MEDRIGWQAMTPVCWSVETWIEDGSQPRTDPIIFFITDPWTGIGMALLLVSDALQVFLKNWAPLVELCY